MLWVKDTTPKINELIQDTLNFSCLIRVETGNVSESPG